MNELLELIDQCIGATACTLESEVASLPISEDERYSAIIEIVVNASSWAVPVIGINRGKLIHDYLLGAY